MAFFDRHLKPSSKPTAAVSGVEKKTARSAAIPEKEEMANEECVRQILAALNTKTPVDETGGQWAYKQFGKKKGNRKFFIQGSDEYIQKIFSALKRLSNIILEQGFSKKTRKPIENACT